MIDMLYGLILFLSALINELKKSTKCVEKPKLSPALMHNLEEYLVRCGIYEPFEKIYVKNAQEFLNADMGRITAVFLISQLPKLQICHTTGELKKLDENVL